MIIALFFRISCLSNDVTMKSRKQNRHRVPIVMYYRNETYDFDRKKRYIAIGRGGFRHVRPNRAPQKGATQKHKIKLFHAAIVVCIAARVLN